MIRGMHDPPRLDGFAADSAKQLIANLYGLDDATRNRLSPAIRWYMRAHRHPAPDEELRIDTFLNYWIAFESLAMPNEDARSALDKLAAIHNCTRDEAREVFPIVRLQGLRSRILHYGEVHPHDHDLNQLMDALCLDVLMHLLDVLAQPRTTAYLDGSANRLITNMRRS